jgi:predicted dienelactone hydrolase
MGAIRHAVSLAAVACGFLLAATEMGTAGTSSVAGAASSAPVATTTMSFVDTSRSTPPWNGMPGTPSRTLVTTIWYPARGSGSVATAGRGAYPLIVFAHGLGGSPQGY